MGIKKTMAAVMTFGAVVLGSTAASAYTPSRGCETVTVERVVDGPGRRDRVVTTTTRTCDAARRDARPAARVVKTTPRVVVRNGRVVSRPSVTIVKKTKAKAKRSKVVRKPATRKVAKRKVVVRERSRPKTVVTKTTTSTTSKHKVAKRRAQAAGR